MNPYQVIIKPWITERATTLTEQNQYVFEVAVDATGPVVVERDMYAAKGLSLIMSIGIPLA